MSDILDLSQIGSGDAERVGSKALTCARMRQAGLPVPDGVVVTAGGEPTAAVLAALRQRLSDWPADDLFAVRSSSLGEDGHLHSFAGMHDTRLNVTLEDLAVAVPACRASAKSPRALAYRAGQGISDGDMRTAVLVQRMVPAILSGVVFTRNPVNGAEEIVINATAGLGEALVSGLADPDEWRICKSDVTLQSFRPGRSTNAEAAGGPLLTDLQVRELSALALRVERLFRAAQDIEWCHDGRQFWIVQSRPITGMRAKNAEVEWTRANVREVLPDLPVPQVSAYVREVLNSGMRLFGGRLYAPESELGPMAEIINGRPYFNLTQMRHLCALTGTPPAQVLRAIGHIEIRPEDELIQPRKWGLLLLALPDLIRVSSYQFHLAGIMRRHLRGLAGECEFAQCCLTGGMDEHAMCAYMQAYRKKAARQLKPVFVLSAITMYQEQLRKLLQRVPFPYEELVPPILAAGEKSVSSQQAFDLLRLAAAARADSAVMQYFVTVASFENYRVMLTGSEFLRRFERFLEEYGHRGHYETDWSLPCYAEDPTPLLAAIRSHVKAPSCPAAETIMAGQEQRAAAAWARFEAALTRSQRLTLRPVVRWLLRRIKRMLLWRELYRSELARGGAIARRWHLQLAAKLIARDWLKTTDEYFLLTYDEIEAVIEARIPLSEVRSIVDRRHADMERWRTLDMPLLLHESDLPRIPSVRRPVTNASAGEFTGLCVSPGVAEAEVIVLHGPDEFSSMKPGAIIVAPATDPSWTPLFTLASGLIVEIGGLLSHSATVAREYGLPALANVSRATQLLKTGDRVCLDATRERAVILPTLQWRHDSTSGPEKEEI